MRAIDRQRSVNRVDAGCIPKRSSMSRNATVVLAILFVLGSSGLSASAFARGGGYGGGGDGFRGNHFRGGFGATAGDGYGGYGNRASGLQSGLPEYGRRDLWGHWGAYYGPMIPRFEPGRSRRLLLRRLASPFDPARCLDHVASSASDILAIAAAVIRVREKKARRRSSRPAAASQQAESGRSMHLSRDRSTNW